MSSPVRVSSLGRFARAALESGEARVIAVFERSAYVETPAGLACVGNVGNGPLNAHCDALPSALSLGDVLSIDAAGATLWQPVRARAFDAGTVTGGLCRLRADALSRVPHEGFAFLLDPVREVPMSIRALARWLAEPSGRPDAAAGLIGLGPGLTPAGDDVIGGMLGALHAAGCATTAGQLSKWALPLARDATNRISFAHLACAAEGECGEAVNDAIVALIAGEAVDLSRIGAIGHTSGWDALAGAALALQALCPPRMVQNAFLPSISTP